MQPAFLSAYMWLLGTVNQQNPGATGSGNRNDPSERSVGFSQVCLPRSEGSVKILPSV